MHEITVQDPSPYVQYASMTKASYMQSQLYRCLCRRAAADQCLLEADH